MKMAMFCPLIGKYPKSSFANENGVISLDAVTGEEAGFLSKLQQGYVLAGEEADVIFYGHSDLSIHDHNWQEMVLEQFLDPEVAVVGFIGALQLGQRDLYKIPYSYTQLARADVFSALTDWELHGNQLFTPMNCAVLDSAAVAVRRSLLDRIGGWQASGLPNSSHCTDLWICLMAARLGYRVRMIPVSCTHSGGGKGDVGSKWLEDRGGDQQLHRAAHTVIYENFRNELPRRVKP